MLLYGPPGTGKTMLAAATASEMDGYFVNVDASSMMSKWLGEAEKNVSKIFKIARTYAEREGKPVILFVDEVDSLLGSRNSEVGGEIRTKNQFPDRDGRGQRQGQGSDAVRDRRHQQAVDAGLAVSEAVPEEEYTWRCPP